MNVELDLVRAILLRLNSVSKHFVSYTEIDGYGDPNQVKEHLELMLEENVITLTTRGVSGDALFDMTTLGCAVFQAIKDDTVWAKIKAKNRPITKISELIEAAKKV